MGQIVSILIYGIIFAYFSIVFFVMLGDNTSFFFFISLFFVSFFVILRYYYFLQKLFYYYYIIIIFFYENHFYFFMFRDVPECSVFRVLSTPWNMANHRFTETVDQRYALVLGTVKRETFLCRFILQILTLLSCTVTYHIHNTKDCQRLQRANRESSLWRNTFLILSFKLFSYLDQKLPYNGNVSAEAYFVAKSAQCFRTMLLFSCFSLIRFFSYL